MQSENQRSKPDKRGKEPDGRGKYELKDSLEDNVNLFRRIFCNDDTFAVRYFENQQCPKVKCCILYIECMVNNELINEHIIKPVMQNTMLNISGNIIDRLQNEVLISNHVERTADVDKLSLAVVYGETVLFLEGAQDGIIICTKGWQTRNIEEPQSERVNRGPREGFTESIMVNLTMIRRKLGTPDLKMKMMTLGVQTHTKVCVCYAEGIVNHKILEEVYKRLGSIHIDGILDVGYIRELIRDSPYSPLKTIGDTERPDTVAGKLLEGRIAIIADGTPVVLTIPYLFLENFQVNEDYYINYYFASIGRILRILGFIITISVPAVYLSMVTYHQEAIPTPLLLSISAARQRVPFPTIIEISLLLFIFEILRETGVRMAYYVGQALSIVGALVLGTASVEARIVSAPIVIVVSITAISGLIIPGIKGVVIIIRAAFLLLSTFLGLYGYIFGLMGFLLHLCGIRSFGVPYMLEFTTFEQSELTDTAIRAPWWHMKLRPGLITGNRVRQAGRGKGP